VALKILFADDSMTAQNMGKKILSDAGYEVVAVSNGAAALKKINELKPELVVLDVYMPGYTGLEVCEKMRSAHETSNTPVLLTVGKMEAYKPEDGARVKANGVIVKPFEATDLLAAIEKLTESVKAGKASQEQDTVAKPVAGGEVEAGAAHDWKTEAVEEIQATKPASVSVPSELASHAAYGFDDLLPASAHADAAGSAAAAPALAVDAAVAAPAISAIPVGQPQTSVTAPQSDNSLESEFAVSPLEISTPEYGATKSFNSDFREPDLVQEQEEPAKAVKPSLLERFDAILKGGVSSGNNRDFEATASEPAGEAPVAIEPGLEVTGQKIDTDSIEIIREPGLDPFSSEATATAQTEYQSWDTTESSASTSQPTAVPSAAPANEVQLEAHPPTGASEPSVLSPETDLDDFEKRVAEAMADFQSSGTGEEHEIASVITEREAEEADFAQSKYAVVQEAEHGHAHATKTWTGETPFDVPVPDVEITDAISESTAETYVLEDPVDNTPLKAAAAAASAGNSELERALAEAVAAQNHRGVTGQDEVPQAEAPALESTPKPVEATMITKIVTRVLEHSLPEILNRVMTELEKEEREKKK
jgi:CheY-like chemotaxis protein